jgi:mannose-6-phosphate isomerase-like protein (cupin superfamily)
MTGGEEAFLGGGGDLKRTLMPKNEEAQNTLEISKELLLKDYGYRSESLWKSEQAGETRVQLFIGFVTAVGAGLGFFVKENLATGESLRFVVLGWLFPLLVVGLVTLARMIIRNEHTDKCKKGLDAIRQVFKDIDKEGLLVHYYPVEPPQGGNRDGSGWWKQYRKAVQPRRFGGLAHTVAAINALIVGGMLAVATNPAGMGESPFWSAASLKEACGYGLVAALIAFMAQLAYVARCAAKTKVKLRKGYPTHAGGVVYKKNTDGVEYLLVSAKKELGRFVLPKGHIEDGEGHGEAALREVREEAGVIARLVGLAANVDFHVGRDRVNAKFYLMEHLFDVEPKERQIKWLPLGEALAMLDELPESKHALIQAEKQRSELHRQANSKILQMKVLPAAMDDRAPDGSELRLLSGLSGGGLCHCTLPAGGTSRAVSHPTVEEIWYFLSGEGTVWRKLGDQEQIVEAHPGVSLTIPLGARFQFRNTGNAPLTFIISTMPPWPGPDEAVPAPGPW